MYLKWLIFNMWHRHSFNEAQVNSHISNKLIDIGYTLLKTFPINSNKHSTNFSDNSVFFFSFADLIDWKVPDYGSCTDAEFRYQIEWQIAVNEQHNKRTPTTPYTWNLWKPYREMLVNVLIWMVLLSSVNVCFPSVFLRLWDNQVGLIWWFVSQLGWLYNRHI